MIWLTWLTPIRRPCPKSGPVIQWLTAGAITVAETSAKPVPSYVSVSENYAVIDVGGVQHLVEEGRWYTCNRLNVRLCFFLCLRPTDLSRISSCWYHYNCQPCRTSKRPREPGKRVGE